MKNNCNNCNRKNNNQAEKMAKNWQDDKNNSDVLGSYTGNPKDKNEKPVQDADDL